MPKIKWFIGQALKKQKQVPPVSRWNRQLNNWEGLEKVKMKIIPAIDILSGKCVRLFQGDYNQETVYGDDPVAMAEKWEAEGAALIHLVDLDGAKLGQPVNTNVIKEICNNVNISCELGGGIRTMEDANNVFAAGIDRIIVGTAACESEALIDGLLSKYGEEKIVIGIDARNGYVAVKGWLEDSDIKAIDLAAKFAAKGVKHFIYTDISRDGALVGPNYESIASFCSYVKDCKVIASGGVGSIEHISKLIKLKKAVENIEGVIVGKALYDGKISLKEAFAQED